jgi:flagellar biosynthesis protein FlhA
MSAVTGALAVAEPRWRTAAEAGVVVGIVAVVALLVVPLSPMLLDLLLALSIASSLVVLLVSLNTTNPLEFSVFPAVLLLMTLYRLALNVSSTRLILGDGSAGQVIEAFGAFVVGGNYAVGIVVFLILVAINFIVITKGAGRVAEVAARFTLDAMPGRQMSIDADLSAGLIDDDEARHQREKISREADFYGAMDGAAKFVRGDAIAGLLITAINILGGLFVGVVQRGMPAGAALTEYTLLTVGDGLVTQIPALIVSTAAGIMVTHSAGESRVGAALLRQVGRHPKAMWIASGFLATLGLVPGLPFLPFLILSAGGAGLAWGMGRQQQEEARRAEAEFHRAEEEPLPPDDPVQDLIQTDKVELQLGYGLIGLVDQEQGGDLLERIRILRKQAAQELGVLIPPIRIRDDARLDPSEYVVRVRGTEVTRWQLVPRHVLALDAGGVLDDMDGIETSDPSFGMPARWIPPAARGDAEANGYVVVDPPTVVATHLMETLKDSGADLLGRQDVREMLDRLKETHPALVEDVVPNRLGLGVIHRVLQRLLRERIPLRDLITVLESLADAADRTQDPEALTEHVRGALTHVIGELYADGRGEVRGVAVGPKLEAALMNFFSPRQGKPESMLRPDTLTGALREVDRITREHAVDGTTPPIVTPPGLRVGVRRLLEPVLPKIPVISLAELPTNVTLTTVAVWELDHGS